ncbi:MAG TPA: dihydrofolate reductase family protein [Mycobacterium sp.]|nr:dihydrofolate reductase family protein [Mycobacterium sp.]
MAKFLYSAAMSLDGFISGPGGDMSWMADYFGPNPAVAELITRTGALLVGNRTFGGDDPNKGGPGEGEVAARRRHPPVRATRRPDRPARADQRCAHGANHEHVVSRCPYSPPALRPVRGQTGVAFGYEHHGCRGRPLGGDHSDDHRGHLPVVE